MGNSIGGKRRRARVMTVDGATYKYRPPAAACDALRDHPGHHLLESEEVRRLGVRARPLDPDAPLKPGKLYFLVHLPRRPRAAAAPQRSWSGALTYHAGAGERLESLMLARRSASDVASSPVAMLMASAAEKTPEAGEGGAVRLRVRLPKADVQRLVEESRDAAEAAERIMELCVARDQRRHRSAPGTPLVVPPPPAIAPPRGKADSKNNATATATAGKKEVRRRSPAERLGRCIDVAMHVVTGTGSMGCR
ncbi:hypothetical protein HU200_060324 [Digitaria exilis]|uniref:Uncharacterized protein n=1 Tax=Digitaria exilis TaxID=1010633 RepID=A0A835AAG0_9POAL|nr:hypothetical protein HU200_060324 [Digitaria exilis]